MTQKTFSTAWKASTQPRKQRKYSYAAPLHLKQKELHAHLAGELRKKYGVRTSRIRKGDTVKILRGQFAQKEGKIERVDVKRTRIFLSGAEIIKKDGSKTLYPLHPSNVIITGLDLGDKKRKAKLEKRSAELPKAESKTKAESKKMNQPHPHQTGGAP